MKIKKDLETMKKVKNNEKITMTNKSYQAKMKREFNKGQVMALHNIGKTNSEIAKILGFKEIAVKSLLSSVLKDDK